MARVVFGKIGINIPRFRNRHVICKSFVVVKCDGMDLMFTFQKAFIMILLAVLLFLFLNLCSLVCRIVLLVMTNSASLWSLPMIKST